MRTDRQADRRTDRHDKANIRFSRFCKRAEKKGVHEYLLHYTFGNVHISVIFSDVEHSIL